MKILLFATVLLLIPINFAAAQELVVFTNSIVYTDEQPLFVYGTAIPGENLIIRLFARTERLPSLIR